MGNMINQGNNGFHLFTVVTDGYGHFIAEDQQGKEVARVKATGEDNAHALMDLTALVRLTLKAQDPEEESGTIQ